MKVAEAAGKALLGLMIGMPRRQPNLRRLVHRRVFQELHAVSAAWMDRHFELIETSAPWLDRIGRDLLDYCRGFARPPGLDPGFRASAGCTRALTVVYGFDGSLLTKLDMFGEALFAAGWGKLKNVRRSGRFAEQLWIPLNGEELLARKDIDSGLGPMHPEWRPNERLSRPAGMEGTPPWGRLPLSPDMSVSCISRDQTRQVMPSDLAGSAQRAPRNYLLLDNTEVERQALEDHALGTHEHALAVNISLQYYSNPNAKASPHRIPRYWLPTRARSRGPSRHHRAE